MDNGKHRTWGGFNRSQMETVTISEFEQLVGKLELQPSEYQDSPELKAWATQHKDQRYVPTELLQAWNLRVLAEV